MLGKTSGNFKGENELPDTTGTDTEKKDSFKGEVSKAINESLNKDIDDFELEIKGPIISAVALEVKRNKEYAIDGFGSDNPEAVKNKHHYVAEEQVDKIKQIPLPKKLKILTEDQAHIFWLKGGAIENDDVQRMKADYHDGKRYIGFLLADKLIESCKRNELGNDCFDYLKEAFFEYLRCLSVEEYIRIKAYYKWEITGRIRNDDKRRMDSDYYQSMECVQNTMWNCKNRKPEEFLKKSSIQLIRDYFTDLGKEHFEDIKKAKIYTGKRLNIELSKEINEFVDQFYNLLQSSLKGDVVYPSAMGSLINHLYANTHIANMLEFILRCFLCSYIERDLHNIIRNNNQKTPLNVAPNCQPQKNCPL